MDDSVLKDFYGKKVDLLLNGQYATELSIDRTAAPTSLEVIAVVSAIQPENTNFLKLDSIRYHLEGRYEQFGVAPVPIRKFEASAIQKKYIIGIFSSPEE
ncbi:hypothetical protein KAJ38_01215 [Candidatus Pacearchaeota archaeon]|nr:hypothetical protein [Candidatus Pacearchaeota archaeon]